MGRHAILVDDEDNQKKGIISPYLVPDIVYIDPQLTISVPAAITAATGLDALTHCLEAYTNKFAQPFIDLYAYEGMRLISSHNSPSKPLIMSEVLRFIISVKPKPV